jgi:hypothetical protein
VRMDERSTRRTTSGPSSSARIVRCSTG